MAINEQWNIKSRAHVCAGSGRFFTEGEVFHTALFETKDGSLERRDYSTEIWSATDGPAKEAFSHWRSTYVPTVRQEKQETMHKESAEELLRRLVTEDEAHTENARFILAVMLERQKILRQTDAHKIGETKLLIYEHRKTGDVLLIRDPEIPLADVDKVQAEVTLLLDQDHPGNEENEDSETNTEPATNLPAEGEVTGSANGDDTSDSAEEEQAPSSPA